MVDFEPPSPNPFGFADHTPFAAFGVELVYGMRPDGSLVHISEAARGLACDCICPACGRTLIARKGTIKVEHFGHYGKGSGCGRNAETNAHSWAKEVLEREKCILLPAVAARVGREVLETHMPQLFTFASAELEKTMDDIVPDVILTTHAGKKLLVEVLVTHACGPEKIAKLKNRGLATVEVDLSALRKSSDRDLIEAALIRNAPRDWLYNSKQENAEEKLRALIAQRAADQAEAERIRQQRAAAEKEAQEAKARRELERKVSQVLHAITAADKSKNDSGREELAQITPDSEFFELLWPDQRTCGFLVPNEQWQAALLMRVVDAPIGEDFYLPEFELNSAIRAIDDCIDGLFSSDLPDDVRLALPHELRSAHFPRRAIEDYLYHLCAIDVLQSDDHGGFELNEDRVRSLKRHQARWELHQQRRGTLERVLAKLVKMLPAEEIRDFDRLAWEQSPIFGFDNLPALLDTEYVNWSKFESALRAVEHLIEGGEAVTETLGLPVHGEMLRANERARQKRQREADARESQVRSAAGQILGAGAHHWLYYPPDADAPLYRSRNSQAGLNEVLSELEGEREIRAQQAREAALAEECRRLLKADADKALDFKLVEPFLHNYDAHLKASPWTVCIDKAGLQRARDELDKWAARNKKRTRRR